MIKDNPTEHSTKGRLLEAAEELFADGGFESVSVRDVTTRAGANVAAVNYHFGSRAGLVNAVIERYVAPMNRERLERLGALERRGDAVVEEIVEAFIRPFVTQVRRSELSERLFAKLMGRTFGSGEGLLPESVLEGFATLAGRFQKALGKVLPGLGEEESFWRLHFMAGAMVHTLAHGDMLQRVTGGRCGDPGIEETLERCIRFVAAGMREGSGESGGRSGAVPQGEFKF